MYKFHFVPLFSAIINLALAALVIATNPRRRLNQIFVLLGVALAWWNFVAYFLSSIQTVEQSLRLYRIGAIGVALIPAALYHLSVEAAGKKRRKLTLIFIYSCSLTFSLLAVSGISMSSSTRRFGDMYRITGNIFVWSYYIYFLTVACSALIESTIAIRTAGPQHRRIIKLALAGISVLALGIMHDGMHLLGLNYYPGTRTGILPLGTGCAALYGLILGYALLSDQMLDFRVSLGKQAATLFRILFLLAITYILLLSIAGILPGTFTNQALLVSLLTFFLSTLIGVRLFPKLLGPYIDHFGRRISGDNFENHDKVRAFITEPAGPETIIQYLDESARLVFDQFGVSAIGINIFCGDKSACGQAIRTTTGTQCDWSFIFGESSDLRKHFKFSDQPYLDIREGLHFAPEERSARDLMRAQSLVLAFPIGTEKKKPIGLLVLSDRKDGKSLNKLDAEVFSLLCQHIATRAERVAIERNEELQQANEAKDRFLASVNHEIRNPLNGITGVAQMLKEYCTEGRSKYLIGTLQSCTEQLRTTMDDVLDFNRIGPDVADNHPAVIDIVELVRSTTSSYDISGGQLVFDRIMSGFEQAGMQESAVRVWCDGGKFSHILINYITNALKYGIPPGAHVQIRAEFIAAGLARITLAVTSTGPTLSHEELISLFTPLTRGRRAQETKAHGMGLGLALCKKLALAMGGNVGVESAHGQTTFWFAADFPLADSSGAEATPGLLKVTGRHALAVEDEPYNRLVLGYHLNRFGISAVWAEDGQTALAAAQNRSFDLIITDWILPDMDGEELLTQLRKKHANPLPPVIVVSAYSTASKQATGLTAGATAFVSKPIDEGKLAEAFAACKLGPAVAGVICDEIVSGSIDLSALKRASTNPNIIESFLREIEESHSKLAANWQSNPRSAVSLAHRLKGQMLLVRAKDCADLLALLERALTDGRSADAAHVLASVQSSFSNVTYTIRALLQQAPQQS